MSVELTGKGKAPWGNHGASRDGRGVVGARGDSRPLAGATPQCLVSSPRLGQQLRDVRRDPPRLVAGEEVRNPGQSLRYIKVTATERCSQMLRPATGFADP